MMSKSENKTDNWIKYAQIYDPIKVGSIDGQDTEPHDNGIIRALNSYYQPNEKVIGDPHCTIFIGRLHIKTNEEKLKSKFSRFGNIKNCRVVRDIITGSSKCYGFIEFEFRSQAKEALYEMNKTLIDNCEILVEFEHERTMKGWKPRRLGGGFGGKKESGQLRFGGRGRPFQKPITTSGVTDFREIFRQQKTKR